MAGHETFKIAVAELSEATEQAAAAAGVELDEIDLFVYHQANARILTAVGERLGLRPRSRRRLHRRPRQHVRGDPAARARSQLRGRALRDGDRVLLGAFGAGFIWGATVLEWGVTR